MAIAPIGPFVRFVVTAGAAVYANWDSIAGLFDRADHDEAGPIYGYHVQHVFEMKDATGSFSARERGMVGVHWLNTTGGDLDASWTSADYALVETGFQTFWTAIAAWLSIDIRLIEHRWYPYGPGVHPPAPPSRVTTLGSPLVGSGSLRTPHQVACNVTFRTPLRRHWGRICLPAGAGSVDPGGVWPTAMVNDFANGASAYVKSGVANGLTPVVFDRQRKTLLGITAVEADNVPDIIRRRRIRTTTYRKILTA